MGFLRQKYCSGLPFPSPEDLSDPEIKPRSPVLQADYLPPNWINVNYSCLKFHTTMVMPSNYLILCHPLLLSSIFPASGSFPMSQLFTSGGQSIGVSASTSVLLMNTQDWVPLWWTGWISLQSKGLSRVFSNTTVQKHQFFGSQLSSQSNSHIPTWLLGKP